MEGQHMSSRIFFSVQLVSGLSDDRVAVLYRDAYTWTSPLWIHTSKVVKPIAAYTSQWALRKVTEEVYRWRSGARHAAANVIFYIKSHEFSVLANLPGPFVVLVVQMTDE